MAATIVAAFFGRGNMASVYKSEQAAVYDYLSDSRIVPECVSVEEYAKVTYDMPTLCGDLYFICDGLQVLPCELALICPDVFMNLLRKHDVSDTVLLELFWDDDSMSIRRAEDGNRIHLPRYEYMWLHLHINTRKYGHVGKISTVVWEYPNLPTYRFVLLTDKGYFVMPRRAGDLSGVSDGVLHTEWHSESDIEECDLMAHVIKRSARSDV